MGGFLLGKAPLPMQDRIARAKRSEIYGPRQDDPQEGFISDPWADYMSRMAQSISAAATRISSASLTDQGASIAGTDISNGGQPAGLYKIFYHARITQAATTSSSLTVTLSWTDGGVAQSQSFAAITGNTTATMQSNFLMIHTDTGTPIQYATTYASVGGTPMQYRFDVVLEVSQA